MTSIQLKLIIQKRMRKRSLRYGEFEDIDYTDYH